MHGCGLHDPGAERGTERRNNDSFGIERDIPINACAS
jgi:hypothetical protein